MVLFVLGYGLITILLFIRPLENWLKKENARAGVKVKVYFITGKKLWNEIKKNITIDSTLV